MTQLPAIFTEKTRQLMGEERFERYLQSFEEDTPVSIRLNPLKMADGRWKMEDAETVPWCRDGYYLKQRPNFTFDPLFHAGCYYVQEAASMFLDEVLRQLAVRNWPLALDLCAAPGGKSTLLRAALPEDCVTIRTSFLPFFSQSLFAGIVSRQESTQKPPSGSSFFPLR